MWCSCGAERDPVAGEWASAFNRATQGYRAGVKGSGSPSQAGRRGSVRKISGERGSTSQGLCHLMRCRRCPQQQRTLPWVPAWMSDVDVCHLRSPIPTYKVAASAGILRQPAPSEEFGRRWLPACANFHRALALRAPMSHSHRKQHRRRTAIHNNAAAAACLPCTLQLLCLLCLLCLLPSSPLDRSVLQPAL